MLILARRKEEKIIIGSGKDQVVLQVCGIDRNYVRLGFTAEKHVPIDREEIREGKMNGFDKE